MAKPWYNFYLLSDATLPEKSRMSFQKSTEPSKSDKNPKTTFK
jgi:hypothetical protein